MRIGSAFDHSSQGISQLNVCKATAHLTSLTVQTEQGTLQNKKKVINQSYIQIIEEKNKCST
jgi:hypothetical protein